MMLNDAEKMWLLQLKTCFSNFILFDLQNPSLEFLHPVTKQGGRPGEALNDPFFPSMADGQMKSQMK